MPWISSYYDKKRRFSSLLLLALSFLAYHDGVSFCCWSSTAARFFVQKITFWWKHERSFRGRSERMIEAHFVILFLAWRHVEDRILLRRFSCACGLLNKTNIAGWRQTASTDGIRELGSSDFRDFVTFSLIDHSTFRLWKPGSWRRTQFHNYTLSLLIAMPLVTWYHRVLPPKRRQFFATRPSSLPIRPHSNSFSNNRTRYFSKHNSFYLLFWIISSERGDGNCRNVSSFLLSFISLPVAGARDFIIKSIQTSEKIYRRSDSTPSLKLGSE